MSFNSNRARKYGSLLILLAVLCIQSCGPDLHLGSTEEPRGDWDGFFDFDGPILSPHNEYDLGSIQRNLLAGDTITLVPKIAMFGAKNYFDDLVIALLIDSIRIPRVQLEVSPSAIRFVVPNNCPSGILKIISYTNDSAAIKRGVLFDTAGFAHLTCLPRDSSIVTLHIDKIRSILFSPDSRFLYVLDSVNNIYQCDLNAGGQKKNIAPPILKDYYLSTPQVSRDGNRLSFITHNQTESSAGVLNVVTGEYSNFRFSRLPYRTPYFDVNTGLCYIQGNPEDSIYNFVKNTFSSRKLPTYMSRFVAFSGDGNYLIEFHPGASNVYDTKTFNLKQQVKNKLQLGYYDESGSNYIVYRGHNGAYVALVDYSDTRIFSTSGIYTGHLPLGYGTPCNIGSNIFAAFYRDYVVFADVQTTNWISSSRIPLATLCGAVSPDDGFFAAASGNKIKVYSLK